MNIQLIDMTVSFKQSQEYILFGDFTYFYGSIGSGKSTIVRLVDYCFGGSIEMTPAMQNEFVSVMLQLTVGNTTVLLYRQRQSEQIQAQWAKEGHEYQVIVAARKLGGEVLPKTGVQNLSDLMFYLAEITPPRVRKSKLREDAPLERLSFRDLLWYCYLDQETIDSDFFYLDPEADFSRRNKSRDVMRFILGYHQERVVELEAALEELREKRLGLTEGAKALQQALEANGITSTIEIQASITSKQDELRAIAAQINQLRSTSNQHTEHGVDRLRQTGRRYALELSQVERAISDLKQTIADDMRHHNEIVSLSVKFRRTTSAKSVLNNVEFENCPRCGQALPERSKPVCRLCNQPEPLPIEGALDITATEKDLANRIMELTNRIERSKEQLKMLQRNHDSLRADKARVDAELDTMMRRYDSAYLSSTLHLEKRESTVQQEIKEMERLEKLAQQVNKQHEEADALEINEKELRRELGDARRSAEQDVKNLQLLGELFLNCLIRARNPGFTSNDKVNISTRTFLPEVYPPEGEGVGTTSFANLGSGGKKTLFKICFAIAIHRLAVRIEATLPTLLIIDSPMKNISERENRIQYEGLHDLLYDLATSELSGTQFIMVDREFHPPSSETNIELVERHMTPDDPDAPPLIRYLLDHK